MCSPKKNLKNPCLNVFNNFIKFDGCNIMKVRHSKIFLPCILSKKIHGWTCKGFF